jgi:hypothetical protein
MEHRRSDACGAWFLAAVQAPDGEPAEPDEVTPPSVIITVSLDDLDGMTGDLLV